MRAATQSKYGPPSVLEVTDIDRPTPGEGEVLIEVRAAAVNPFANSATLSGRTAAEMGVTAPLATTLADALRTRLA